MRLPDRAKGILAIAICALSIGALRLSLRAEHLLGADHGGKYIQAVSLLRNDFKSERILYLAAAIDPEYVYCPLGLVRNGAEFVSPFPVALAAVSALLIPLGGPSAIYWFSAISLMGIFALLLFWDRSGFLPLFLLFFSSLLTIGFLFVDVNLFMLLLLSGLTLFHFARQRSLMFVGGLLAGMSALFRLEGILFVGLFVLFRGAAEWRAEARRESGSFRGLGHLALFFLGFALACAALGAYNGVQYGAILGPRMAANPASFAAGVSERLLNTVGLLIGGNGRLGFFAFMPFFAVVLVLWLARSSVTQGLSPGLRVLIRTAGAFIVLATVLAPNDSNIDFGSRYLVSAVFPLGLAAREIIQRRVHMRRGPRIWLAGALLFSLAVSLSVQYLTLRQIARSARLIGGFSESLRQHESDGLVLQDPVAMNLVGMEYPEKPTVLLQTPEQVADFLPKLKSLGVKHPLLLISRPPKLPEGVDPKILAFVISTYMSDEERTRYLEKVADTYRWSLVNPGRDVDIYKLELRETPSR